MEINRRRLLKALALAPFASFGSPEASSMVWGSHGSCNCINVLLHGFWFMEIQDNMLVAASPALANGHHFRFRDKGMPLQDFSGTIDLRGPLRDGAGHRKSFPDRILQFSWSDINPDPNRRQYFIDLNTAPACACILLLPLPKEIFSLRAGLRSNFPARDGNVWSSIKNKSNSEHVALITRLKYGHISNSPFSSPVRSFFAQHCHKPTVCEVNEVLKAAQSCFAQEFDLCLKPTLEIHVEPDRYEDLPDEIDPADEAALSEINDCPEQDHHITAANPCAEGQPSDCFVKAVEVANCPIFVVAP